MAEEIMAGRQARFTCDASEEIPSARQVHTNSSTRSFAYGDSTIEIIDGIWHMQIRENSYYAGGLAVGRLLAAAEYPAVNFFRKPHITALFCFFYIFARSHFRKIRIPKRYLEELRGYAEGTGISYRTLFCMNFIFDVLKKYGLHCSSVTVAEPDGRMVIGRNTDLFPWIGRLALRWCPSIVLEVTTPSKFRYVHVTPGLFLGVFNGFNERGIIVLSHQIAATKERAVSGNLATTLLQRVLLEESADIALAESITRSNPIQRCIGNMIVSSAEGECCIFEISPGAVKKLCRDTGYLCCVTHFQDEELAKLHRKNTMASEDRLALMNSLAKKAKATPEDVIAILKNSDNGIRFRDSGRSPTNEGTYQSMVFDIAGQRIFVADGRTLPVSHSGIYREISVNVCGP
jgi:GNAT superfamily N-acetyltransferase